MKTNRNEVKYYYWVSTTQLEIGCQQKNGIMKTTGDFGFDLFGEHEIVTFYKEITEEQFLCLSVKQQLRLGGGTLNV